MKLLASVLVLSVGLNAALLATFFAKPSLAPPSLRRVFETAGSAAETDKRGAGERKSRPAAKVAKTEDLWTQLRHDDLPTLIARLRAAGFPPSAIRSIAEAEILERFKPRLDELRRQLDETPYWRGDITQFMGTSKLYEQMSQISRERTKALRGLIGTDAYAYAGLNPSDVQRQRFGNLSPGKIELVQRITDDYAEMTSQIRSAMQGITLPEDKEKFALLEREKRADLASILTPEELADYEMRTSQLTMRLRTTFSIMDASEAEFRAIYNAYQPHIETLFPTTPSGVVFLSSQTEDPRRVANERVNADIKQSLGADRFAQYQRANDRDFQQLYQLTRADNVPYDTLVRAYDGRQAASDASMKIASDSALSMEQKREALKNLAQQSRTQLLSTLGPGAGPSYAQNSRWLTGLEQGRPFTIGPDGNIRTSSISMPPPASKAATPKQ